MYSSNSEIPVILLAFANDAASPLRELAIESDTLHTIFRQAEREGKCKVEVIAAASAEKIIDVFQRFRSRIRIFHYGGHSDQESIFLKGAFQQANTPNSANELADFLALQEQLELVFLNSCVSLTQAKIYQACGVKTVIATSQKVGDATAREFSKLFYQGIATGATISNAYQEAQAGLKLTLPGRWRMGRLTNHDNPIPDEFPWQLFPEQPAEWRLPLTAKKLTRIPPIDLKKDCLGRDNDLRRLQTTLEASSRAVVINGLGGVGKTVFANAYVKKHASNYDHIAWINRGEDLITAFTQNNYLSDALGIPFIEKELPQDRFGRVLHKINQLPGHNLLVIDNVQEKIAQKEIHELLPIPPNWHVLLSSRLALDLFESFKLDALIPADAQKLFLKHYQGDWTPEDLTTLLSEIGYHTLTIELLAKLLEKLNYILSIPELTRVLKQQQLNNTELQEKIWARHSGDERGIYLHLMKAFELTKVTETETSLLKQFIVLPVKSYDIPTLTDLLQTKPLILSKTLNSLAAKGWISKHDDKSFSIHRLIKQVITYQLQPDYNDIAILVEQIIKKTNSDPYVNRTAINFIWSTHAVELEQYLKKEQNDSVAILQNNLGAIFRELGKYEQSLEYLKKAIFNREINDPETNKLILSRSYNELGLTYSDLGKFSKALDYFRQVLAIRIEIQPCKDLGLAQAYNNIALAHRNLGQYEEAYVFHHRALNIMEDALEENHPRLAIAYSNLGMTLKANGAYEEALSYYQKALAIRKKAFEPNDIKIAQSYNNLANIYSLLNKKHTSLSYHEKSLKIKENCLATDHPEIAHTYNNMALVYYDLGQTEKAIYYNKKAINIREKVHGQNHPDTALSYNNIGLVYQSSGKLQEGFEYLEKAMHIREKILNPNHPDLAQSYNNIAIDKNNIKRYDEALALHSKALTIRKKILGDKHPNLAQTYNNIGVTLEKMEDYKSALDYHLKAIGIREEVLVTDHPDLAQSYRNIARVYKNLKNHKLAKFYQAKVDNKSAIQSKGIWAFLKNLFSKK